MSPIDQTPARRSPLVRTFVVSSYSVLGWLVVGWLVVSVLAIKYQRTLLYPVGSVPVYEVWALPGIEKVAVRTADGQTLKGYFRAPLDGSPVVVTFHGNGSPAESHAFRFAAPPWSDHGWGFLAVAYRGYPGSTGSPTEDGLMLDGEAAVAFVAARAPGAPVLFHGHSLGTAVAVRMAAQHPSVGLYLEAPFSSMSAVAAAAFPLLPTRFLWDTFRSEDVVCAVASPILAVHGADDKVIPPSIGSRLFAARRRDGPAASSFRVAEGYDHNSVFGAMDREAEALFRASPPVPPKPATCSSGVSVR